MTNAPAFFRNNIVLAFGGGCAVLLFGLILGTATSDTLQQRASAYSDVPSDSSPAQAIEEMSRIGILQGYENGLFGPNDPVTRGQMAIIMQRERDREIKALHAKIEEIRAKLSLGTCGDGDTQTGEECDDGNTESSDGCSAECLEEVLRDGCPGGYRIGEEYPAEDGCNTCICTQSGVVCTKMHCAPPEEPVVEEPPSDTPVEEAAAPHIAPTCGNGICEHDENVLPPHRRFHCPQDCTGEPYQRQCEDLTQAWKEIPGASRTCQSDVDCTKIEQGCPFITCGEAVNKMSYPNLSLAMDDLLQTCQREGAIKTCVTCPYSASLCIEGQCVLVKEHR